MNQDSSTPRFAPVRPEALEMNEAEKRFLAAEEARLGQKLEELSKTPTYNMCFACGEANPIGLHLHFFLIPDGCMAFFTPLPEHQSYNGPASTCVSANPYGSGRPSSAWAAKSNAKAASSSWKGKSSTKTGPLRRKRKAI